MKDHEIAALVGRLTEIAKTYHATQQLRERIAQEVRESVERWHSEFAALHRVEGLVNKVYKAKGRYHTQHAMCDLYDAVGIPNERPQ